MKKVFTLVFVVCFSLLRVSAQSGDTSHFNTFNPQVGDYIRLSIISDWCSPHIRPDAAKELDDNAVSVIKKYPNLIFQLEVHSDCRGDSLYNREFTQRRADSLLAYY
jgi:hypothetical protein